jgi:hypothetical protein
MEKGDGWMGVWRKLELANEGCEALQGEAFASCEENRQWRKGKNPVAASHMRMVSPEKIHHTIKRHFVRVVPSTWVRISLLHILHSEHCVAEARLCRTRMVDVVSLGIYMH